MKKWFVVLLTVVAVVLPFAPQAMAQIESQGSACSQTYVVQSGDRLFRIAQRFGTTVERLQALNGIPNPNRIFVGQVLCVSTVYVPPPPPPPPQYYTVQRGDTLSRIARRFGVNLSVLAQVNNIRNINRIYVGQVLVIPDVTIQY